MMPCFRRYLIALAACAIPAAAFATQPKVDADTCTQLRLEEIKFRQSGILDDMAKGPAWAKANLPPERLREIEHYIALDEQVQFGCRDAKLTPEAEKASEAAARIEINSDADPTAPLAVPGNASGTDAAGAAAKPPAAAKKPAQKKTSRKKSKAPPPDAENLPPVHKDPKSTMTAAPAPEAPSAAPDASSAAANTAGAAAPELPGFGFGETVVIPPAPSP